MRRRLLGLFTLALLACGPEHGTGTRTPSASASASTGPDGGPAGAAVPVDPAVVPPVSAGDLKSGARLLSVTRPGAVLAEIRVVVRTGSADDADHAGTARVVGRAMQAAYKTAATNDGRASNELSVRVSPNATTFALRCAADGVGPSLKALATAFAKTELDQAAVRTATASVIEDLKADRANLEGIGPRLVQRDLFVAPIGRHPYSVLLLGADDVAGVEPKSASAFLSSFYVAANITLVVVSAASADAVRTDAETSLAALRVGDARAADVDAPEGRARAMKVMLVDVPGQDPVRVTLGKFGPTAAQQSETNTRLFGATLVERLSRAGIAKARFEIAPFRGAPLIAMLRADLPAVSAADAIGKIHDAVSSFGAPSANELVVARNVATGDILRSIDPPGAYADALALGASVDASETAFERRTLELPAAEADDVGVTANAILGHDGILVVVGDAKSLAPALTKFGDVDILDPATFTRVRTVSP